jgi:hypothetical protein
MTWVGGLPPSPRTRQSSYRTHLPSRFSMAPPAMSWMNEGLWQVRVMVERLVDKVFSSLPFRKAYHFIGGLALFLLTLFLGDTAFFIACALYLLAFLAFGARVSFAVIGVASLFAITRSRFATLGAIVIFTRGDGLSAVIGSCYGKRWLPWNAQRSIAGSIAILAGAIIGTFIFIPCASPVTGWERALVVGLPSVAGCIAESLPITLIRDRKPDDNLIIILVSGLTLRVLMALLAFPEPSFLQLAR